MRHLLFFLSLIFLNLNAQTDFKFDKRFVQSENKWVAFPMEKDSSFIYGFIYIDAEAGLTFNYEGNYKISPIGKLIPKKIENTGMKVRLQPNNVLVAFIPENRFQELEIEATPDWLKFYKTDTTSIERLYRWGFLYNGWNECSKALTFLEDAQKINPKFKGLEVELAFSYNCLGEYEKAILVLQGALETNPTDSYINKELIYAQVKLGQLDIAAKSCMKAIKICKDNTYNGENCYNLLANYYNRKDKENFNLWLEETKKWNSGNLDMKNSIEMMEKELNK